ncbi:MAG: hypothetical protein WBQ05_16480 [Candidatus Competibacter denitrificans]
MAYLESRIERPTQNLVYIETSEPGRKGEPMNPEAAIEHINKRPKENFTIYYKAPITVREIQRRSKNYQIKYIPWEQKILLEMIKKRTRLGLEILKKSLAMPAVGSRRA